MNSFVLCPSPITTQNRVLGRTPGQTGLSGIPFVDVLGPADRSHIFQRPVETAPGFTCGAHARAVHVEVQRIGVRPAWGARAGGTARETSGGWCGGWGG